MSKIKVVIIDDEKLILWSLKEELEKEGYQIFTAQTGEEGLSIIKNEIPDLILLDIKLPGADGIKILKMIKEIDENFLAIMITAHAEVTTAVQAMKLGAYDYITKPFRLDEVKIDIKRALETTSLKRELQKIKLQQKKSYGFDHIVGQSPQMLQVLELMKKVSKSDATTILMQGESGTGKDLIARAIHFQSMRAEHPFMEINCTSIPETLLESELFGHEKGAFTDAKASKKGLFELADGGSVYLDEIGDMNKSAQAKLLRVIEAKTFKRLGGVDDINVNIRVIAATNKDLTQEVKKENFRQDLYYRLKVITINLPPLRERRDDIIPLIKYFINNFNTEFKKRIKGVSKEAEMKLVEYDWPGNVRELRNVIERAIILESEDIILPEHLPLEITSTMSIEKDSEQDFKIPKEGISMDDVERKFIHQALEISHWNQSKAARLLNISRDTLRYRMQKYNIVDKNSK